MPDMAVDSSGRIYVSDSDHARVQRYDASGTLLDTFVGTLDDPYTADLASINSPWGLTVASDGSMLVVEDRGYRLLKLNSAGVQQWTKGTAGVGGSDNDHFWELEGKPALAANGNIYVPDSGNDRIQVFNASTGAYVSTFGSFGTTGNDKFNFPAGIVISPVNGDFYVVDEGNHRVQVYDTTLTLAGYKTTLGITGSSGNDSTRFNTPWDVAVDASGNIYVADGNNHRVQKCTLAGTAYNCTTFAGTTSTSGSTFDHLSNPYGVAIDGAGRVYIADGGNNRIQVFDSTGAYLTTIGQSYGNQTGQLRSPSGVAFDGAGNVYVADYINHRIQKYALGVPGWLQANINGFGDQQTRRVMTLEVFNNQLYAGTMNYTSGGRIWRTTDGHTWTTASEPGFGSIYTNTNPIVSDMIEFKNQLYAGVGSWVSDSVPGQIWRSPDGTTWSLVEGGGFGNANNILISRFGIFSNMLYASTRSNAGGLEIWRSGTGNGGDWTRVVTGGNGDTDNYVCASFIEFGGYLYASVENTVEGTEIWRTNDGLTWTRVITGGFGDVQNKDPGTLAVLGNYMYVGTSNSANGAQLWRSDNGLDWTQVVSNGGGDSNNTKINPIAAVGGSLYAGVYNSVTGVKVWRSPDGTTWSQVNPDGFGDSNNVSTSGIANFNNRFFIGTLNSAHGGEVWQLTGYPLYLPLILK
jgi:hypothetical protein